MNERWLETSMALYPYHFCNIYNGSSIFVFGWKVIENHLNGVFLCKFIETNHHQVLLWPFSCMEGKANPRCSM